MLDFSNPSGPTPIPERLANHSVPEMLKRLFDELKRLVQHTELTAKFGDGAILTLNKLIHDVCGFGFTAFNTIGEDAVQALADEFMHRDGYQLYWFGRPSFDYALSVWQNFLHHPGPALLTPDEQKLYSLRKYEPPDIRAKAFIPFPGLRIIQSWTKAVKDVMRDLDNNVGIYFV